MDEQNNKKKRIKNFFSIAGSVFGGIVVLIAAILYIYADKVFDASGEIYRHAIYITAGAYIVVFIAALIVLTIFKVRLFSKSTYDASISEYRNSNEQLQNSIQLIDKFNRELSASLISLSDSINIEKSLISQIEISRFVLNGKAVIDLEASVGNYNDINKHCKIYIQTSKFLLEKGPLESTILWNLRKGVKYIYIIPKSVAYINEYYEMLRDWYYNYSSFLFSEEAYKSLVSELNTNQEYRKYWCREYQSLFDQAGKLWKNVKLSKQDRNKKLEEYRAKCKELFKSLIETHVEDDSEFYITIAVYEVKKTQWEAIIKLPTQNVNDEYYAFQIPSDPKTELQSFIRTFQNRFKSCSYDSNESSSFGGKLDLDFSRIFI